jgi:arylesterase/paraoxonase
MRTILLLVALLVLLAAGRVLQTLWVAGAFKSLEPHFAGQCTEVGGAVGPEDITIHPRTGVAYISAYNRRATARGEPGRGALYAYDLGSQRPRLVNLTPDADPDFRPHGISLHPDARSGEVLYVINHAGGKHTIEVFDLVGGSLRKRTTLSDPLLVSPNDLVAVGHDQLYITNDHGYASGLMRTLEDFGRLPFSNVIYFDGSRFSEAVSRITYANGINTSHDGRTVYVASVTGRAVRVYDREPESGLLTSREKIRAASGVDNIEVDAQGNLWIGAHPQLLRVMAHTADPAERSPSQVLRVSRGPEGYSVEEVYLDLGDQISGSSVAAVRGDRLLIGAIHDPRFLDCRLPARP